MNRKSFTLLLCVAAALLAGVAVTVAQGGLTLAPLGTAFTYQGSLMDGGGPANGPYDFEFKLFDASSGPAQVGSTLTREDVLVRRGVFSVALDFGSVFDGTARWLEIGVRPGADTGAFTTLSPRQPLTPAPYALYSAAVPWSGIDSRPPGLDDGDDNTTYTAGDGLALSGTEFRGKGTAYENVIIVAKSGGDFDSVQAALDSISTASSNNRYLVWIGPGTYNEQVTMKEYVDVEGAGEGMTIITYAGASASSTGFTVEGANNAELRFLTVENTGGDTYAQGIYTYGTSPRVQHVTVLASGGTTFSQGVYCSGSAAPELDNVTIKVTGGGTNSIGVRNTNGDPILTNVKIEVTGGTSNDYGLQNSYGASPVIQNSTINSAEMGIYNSFSDDPALVVVNHSQIYAGSTGATIYNVDNFTTTVGVTLLSGGAVNTVGGTVTCAGVYDEDYTFYTSTCP